MSTFNSLAVGEGLEGVGNAVLDGGFETFNSLAVGEGLEGRRR